MRRFVPVKWGTGLMRMLTRSKDLTTKHQIQGGAGKRLCQQVPVEHSLANLDSGFQLPALE